MYHSQSAVIRTVSEQNIIEDNLLWQEDKSMHEIYWPWFWNIKWSNYSIKYFRYTVNIKNSSIPLYNMVYRYDYTSCLIVIQLQRFKGQIVSVSSLWKISQLTCMRQILYSHVPKSMQLAVVLKMYCKLMFLSLS